APFNVGTLSQEAALAALDDNEHLETSRKLNRTERERLTRELYERGLKVTPSQANFLLVDLLDKFNKLDTQRPGRALYQALLHKGIIVRPFDKLPTSLRITVGTPEE